VRVCEWPKGYQIPRSISWPDHDTFFLNGIYGVKVSTLWGDSIANFIHITGKGFSMKRVLLSILVLGAMSLVGCKYYEEYWNECDGGDGCDDSLDASKECDQDECDQNGDVFCFGSGGTRDECNVCPDAGMECDPIRDGFCCGSYGTWKTAVVWQPGTNLVWLRCPYGQSYDDESCLCKPNTGSTSDERVTWCNATGISEGDSGACTADNPGINICEATHGEGWRLPTVEEMTVLLEKASMNSPGKTCNGDDGETMCTRMFGRDDSFYWTPAEYTYFTTWEAYYVRFSGASFDVSSKSAEIAVRCLLDGP
jgi:hypothetical protein